MKKPEEYAAEALRYLTLKGGRSARLEAERTVTEVFRQAITDARAEQRSEDARLRQVATGQPLPDIF